MKTKSMSICLVILFLVILVTNLVSANGYYFVCLKKGEQINFGKLCNPKMGTITGPDNICVHALDNGKKCPASLNVCNSLPNSGCSAIGSYNDSGIGNVDTTPPVITLTNPVNNELYSQKSIMLSIDMNKNANLYYQLNGKAKLTRICTNCISISKKITFAEGQNDMTIIVKDQFGNEAYQNITFFIDSKKPQINKVEPQGKFADGEFIITYSETNVKRIVLNYGNSETGFREVNLTNCSSGKKQTCSATTNLVNYDGEEIQYMFTIIDIADNSVSSKPKILDVDISSPVISDLYYVVNGNNVYLRMKVTEQNLDKVEYIDNTALKPKLTTLCSTLKDNMCEKKITLKAGTHDIEIRASDKAGNMISQSLTIEV